MPPDRVHTAGAAMIGPEWALRYAFVVFLAATVLAIRLPPRVDSSQGEEPMGFLRGARTGEKRIGIEARVGNA